MAGLPFRHGEITYGASDAGCRRRQLTHGAWVDHQPGWLGGADELFASLLAATPWGQHERWMYERKVIEPRLTHRWRLDAETTAESEADGIPPVLEGMAASLTYLPGPGDLLVMGGSCQRTWDHAVPKVAASGPRISIQFRHAYPR